MITLPNDLRFVIRSLRYLPAHGATRADSVTALSSE
jgi:hypothetical protein